MSDDGIESSEDATTAADPAGASASVGDTSRALARPSTAAWQTWLSALARRSGRSAALVERPGNEDASIRLTAFASSESVEWQRLWLATQQRRWSSLAIIAADGATPTAQIARSLAEVGSCHLGPTIMAADARTLALTQLQATIDAWVERPEGVQRMLIALGAVLEDPAGLALARACDAALLCLRLGEDSIVQATRTIEAVGRERFLGSVLFRRGRGKS